MNSDLLLRSKISKTKFDINDSPSKEERTENSEKSISTCISINSNNNLIYTENSNKTNYDSNLTYFYFSDSIKFLSESLSPFINLDESKNCVKREIISNDFVNNINKKNQKTVTNGSINNEKKNYILEIKNDSNDDDNSNLKNNIKIDNQSQNVSINEINYTVDLNNFKENNLIKKINNEITDNESHKFRCNNNKFNGNITNIYNFNINIRYISKNKKTKNRSHYLEKNKIYNINKYDSFNDKELEVIKKPKEIREGDWLCPICANINFSFRKFCNKCSFFRKNN